MRLYFKINRKSGRQVLKWEMGRKQEQCNRVLYEETAEGRNVWLGSVWLLEVTLRVGI